MQVLHELKLPLFRDPKGVNPFGEKPRIFEKILVKNLSLLIAERAGPDRARLLAVSGGSAKANAQRQPEPLPTAMTDAALDRKHPRLH